MPAMADDSEETVTAATTEDVPDVQETDDSVSEDDEGEIASTGGTAIDSAEVEAELQVLVCSPSETYYSWSYMKNPWLITHAKSYENYSDSAATYTKSVTKVASVTASATVTSGITIGADIIIAKLDGQFSYDLALSGTTTNEGTESITATMKPGHIYVFYAGARKTSGYYTYYQCSANGTTAKIKSKGRALSFGLNREGALRCGATVSTASLAYVVDAKYC